VTPDESELRRLREAATQGEWEVEDRGTRTLEEAGACITNEKGRVIVDILNASDTEVITEDYRWYSSGIRRRDLDFIAYAANHALTIIDEKNARIAEWQRNSNQLELEKMELIAAVESLMRDGSDTYRFRVMYEAKDLLTKLKGGA